MVILITICNISILSAQEIKTPDENLTKGYIVIDGSKLDYVVRGNGISCLIIGSSVYYPKAFSHDLDKYLKMYFVDMKWFAKDYKPERLDSVTIQSIVEDVEEIRNKLHLKNPVLMGHSIHGTIAMEYVKQYPDKVSALILIGSPSEWGNTTFNQKSEALWNTASDERKAIQKQNWGDVTELDRLTGKEETVAVYNRSAPQYWYDPYYDASWLWDGMTVHTELTNHLFTTVFADYNMFETSQLIPVPVFVALGKYDYVIPHTLWETEYENIPDFTLVLFEKSGHTPQLEERQLFNKILIDWLYSKISQ